MDDYKPTIAERYIVATETSDLRIRIDRQNRADVIVAAGLSKACGVVFERLRSEFDQAKAEVSREAAGQDIGGINERMLIMLRLKSLPEAKRLMLAMADSRVGQARLRFHRGRAAELAWQALSTWLDPRCATCCGTGKIGGYNGKIQSTCNRCDGGSRRGFVGKTDGERAMVAGLICDIEEALQAFESAVSHALWA